MTNQRKKQAGSARAWWLGAVLATVLAALILVAPVVVGEDPAKVKYDEISLEEWGRLSSESLGAALADGTLSPNAQAGNFSLLAAAVSHGKLEHFRILMKNNADPNKESAILPLHTASIKGRVEMAGALIKAGADVDGRNAHGHTAGVLAIGVGYVDGRIDEGQTIDVIKLLLDSGADINAADDKGFGMLHHAIRVCNKRLVRFLLNRGADANGAKNQHKTMTPLISAMAIYPDVMPMLIEAGADVNKKSNKITPLHVAALMPSITPLHIVLNSGADVDGSAGATALQWAKNKSKGEYEGIRATIEASMTEARDACKSAPIPPNQAKWRESGRQAVQLLLAHGAEERDVNFSPKNVTALWMYKEMDNGG